jgi:two-component system chemotaxis response regulator CheB
LAGIVLTGASSDGARGLQAVYEAGGIALVQSPESAQAPTLPAAALAACPNAYVRNLEQIPEFLHDLSRKRST